MGAGTAKRSGWRATVILRGRAEPVIVVGLDEEPSPRRHVEGPRVHRREGREDARLLSLYSVLV